KNIGDLDGITVTVEEKANDKGHLFAGVHKNEVVKFLKEQTRLDINESWIVMDKPIKTTGEFDIEVKPAEAKKSAKFKLVIVGNK
ncbi:hypothetical protein IT397_03375, partial [Candidatus Nomurabacteria bacterium]|nr:hypothetical protein [Candidatus Nomurabacteria bacterium]